MTEIIPAMILSFAFIHINYKKYSLISRLNEVMLFKKMIFNKKLGIRVGKKITVSYFFLNAFFICGIYNVLLLFCIEEETFTPEFLMFFLVFPITRLIYEFIVIPISISNNAAANYSQNTYVQSPLQQDYAASRQTNTNNQSQQNAQDSLSIGDEFKFCSQCGTRYNASDSKCPNCGMQ